MKILFLSIICLMGSLSAERYDTYKRALTQQIEALEDEVAKRPMPTKEQREARDGVYLAIVHQLDQAVFVLSKEEVKFAESKNEMNETYSCLCKAKHPTSEMQVAYEGAIKKYDESREQFDKAAYDLALAKHAFVRLKQEKVWHEKMWQWHIDARVELDRLEEALDNCFLRDRLQN